jgi:hypothetical protein
MKQPTIKQVLRAFRNQKIIEIQRACTTVCRYKIDEHGDVWYDDGDGDWIQTNDVFVPIKAPPGGRIRILPKQRTYEDVVHDPIPGDVVKGRVENKLNCDWIVYYVSVHNVFAENTMGEGGSWSKARWTEWLTRNKPVLVPIQNIKKYESNTLADESGSEL